jgi:hypothetical protein
MKAGGLPAGGRGGWAGRASPVRATGVPTAAARPTRRPQKEQRIQEHKAAARKLDAAGRIKSAADGTAGTGQGPPRQEQQQQQQDADAGPSTSGQPQRQQRQGQEAGDGAGKAQDKAQDKAKARGGGPGAELHDGQAVPGGPDQGSAVYRRSVFEAEPKKSLKQTKNE